MNICDSLLIGSFYLLFNQLVCYASNVDEETCNTPFQKPGKCVQIKSCPELSNLLRRRPLLVEDVNYLRKSQCGFEGKSPKVCCYEPSPSLNLLSSSSSPSLTGASPRPDDLLPGADTCGLHMYNVHKGRVNASNLEFPWLALIEHKGPDGRGFHCGGTLISNRYILTAAHCIRLIPDDWNLVSIRLGENNLYDPRDCESLEQCADSQVDVSIESITVHEDYDQDDISQFHDVALIRLAKKVNFTDFVRPICLPTSSEILDDVYIGSRMYTAGWGLINEKRYHSHNKQKHIVEVKSHLDCTVAYEALTVHLYDQLCIDEGDCATDSGGSIVIEKETSSGYNWFAVGMQSFGPSPCGNNNWPGVYTKITNYMVWIRDHLKP